MSAADKLTRIAIVDSDKCKPKKCRQECKRSCPVVRMGKLCIEVAPTSKIAWISEELCIGCGICVKKCFADDTRVLTERGMLFIDELEALRDGPGLPLFGCYDVHTRALVYRAGILVKPPQASRMLSFTQATEHTRWSAQSDDYGGGGQMESSHSNQLSIRVTADHDLFVQTGAQNRSGFESEMAGGAPAPPRKEKAAALAALGEGRGIRMLASAESGVAGEPSVLAAELCSALALQTEQHVLAFLELYGFWLGDGYLEYDRDGSAAAVCFGQRNTSDIAWLRTQLHMAGLPAHKVTERYSPINGVRTFAVTERQWIAYFDAQYRSKHRPGVPSLRPAASFFVSASVAPLDAAAAPIKPFSAAAVVSPAEQQDKPLTVAELDLTHVDADMIRQLEEAGVQLPNLTSPKRFCSWVLKCCSSAQLRLIIQGLSRADGDWTDGDKGGQHVIHTSSVVFRDEVCIALLHAGYSSDFTVRHRAGSVRGYLKKIQYRTPGEDPARRVYQPSEIIGREHMFRGIVANQDSWSVRFSAPDSVSGKHASRPTMNAGDVLDEPYTGRTWCLTVGHDDHLVFAQRAHRNAQGVVTKASRPIVIGQCPFEAIQIINLPKNLEKDTTHRYGPNSFKLHRLPMPRPGQVLGLVGTNGIGKSTALMILAGKLKPNLGRFDHPPDWQEILVNFRGSELQNFFTKLLEDNIKAIIKPQYVDSIPRSVKGKVLEIIMRKDDRKVHVHVNEVLELGAVLDRDIANLSGGELQRFAIAVTCCQSADIYMFDEPSSYLDVRQRLRAAQAIRELCVEDKYVIAVEHDLSVLDYLSDYVSCLYGKPGAYGVVTAPFSVREGINIFLAGFVPTENLRFRQVELSFKVAEGVQNQAEEEAKRHTTVNYPAMTKVLGDFKLAVEPGGFSESEIIVMLGQNGTGKTTFIKMLAGLLAPDDGGKVPPLNVSYKPQKIAPKFEGTVRQLLHQKIRQMYQHPQFNADVMRPLNIDDIIEQEVKNLSGGELQRVALTLALGKPADIYLIDEPSAYLDSEQRIHAAKVIKRFILHAKKTAFVVEHDFIMATYLADRVIVYDGIPARDAIAHSPQPLLTGMNKFLKDLQITFRRDPSNHRPRINKQNSVKDKAQKLAGTFFYLDTDEEDEDVPESKADKKKREKKLAEEKKEQDRDEKRAAEKARNRADDETDD